MTRVLAAEILKVRTIRGPWILIASAAAFALLGIAMIRAFVTRSPGAVEGATQQLAWFDLTVASVFALLIGVLIGTVDHRHGTIVPSLIVDPSRARLAVSKALVAGLCGLVLAVVVAGATAVAVPIALSVMEVEMVVGWNAIVGLWSRGAVVLALWGLMGVGLGLLIVRQTAAVIIALVVTFVVTPTLAALLPDVARFLPEVLQASVVGAAQLEGTAIAGVAQFGRLAASAGLALWAGGLVALGMARLTRADLAAGSSA